MARLVQHNYGKSRVRLAKITRHPDRHDFTELTVDTALEGDFETAHLEGDNSKVIPTDTQKNTVHALALDHALEDIESFGIALGRHFVDSFPAIVTTLEAYRPWRSAPSPRFRGRRNRAPPGGSHRNPRRRAYSRRHPGPARPQDHQLRVQGLSP